ncbi:MAG: hypothetical protein JKY67_22585 [Pseudomonadales bacterium]|nr:hypothetical protein [Pseudomonadales bacterium]
MIFKESYLKSEKVKIEGTGDECTLYEISSLERVKVLGMMTDEEGEDRFERGLERELYLVSCSLKPGIDGFDFDKTKRELERLPERILSKLTLIAMKLSGFFMDEEDGKNQKVGK